MTPHRRRKKATKRTRELDDETEHVETSPAEINTESDKDEDSDDDPIGEVDWTFWGTK